jgi:hypothetical protein
MLYHPIKLYPMFVCQEQRVIMPSQIPKKGSAPPSKSRDHRMGVHLNQHIGLPITSSNFIRTPSEGQNFDLAKHIVSSTRYEYSIHYIVSYDTKHCV